MTEKQDRLIMPGQGPTDEDLRHDAELTRQEMAETVAALADKVNVKARLHDKADELRDRGDHLVERLPEPVRPVVTTATHRPLIPLAALLLFLLAVRLVRRQRANSGEH